MKKSRKIMGILLSAVLTAAFLAGCGKTGETSEGKADDVSKEAEKVNLKFYIWSDEENYMTEVAENYNKSQDDVEVEIVSIPNDTYDDKLKIMLSAGSDADIVDIRSVDQVMQYQQSDALINITDYLKESDLEISSYGATWDETYPDGQIYALPTRTTCWMLFYNVDLFEEAGITMPEQPTWDDYREMAQQLTAEDGSQYGGSWLDWEGVYQVLATQKGTYLIDDDITDAKDGIAYINALLNEDASHTPLQEIKGNDSKYLADFENETTAMLINGEWLINMLLTDSAEGKTEVNWEVAPMPVAEGMDPGTTWGSFQFAAVPKDAPHPEESFDFLSYLCGDGGAEVLPKYGMLPAYSSETAQEAFDEAVGKESASEVIFNAKKIPEAPSYVNYYELSTAFSEHVELYFFGEKELDETMENFEKQRETIMSK